MAKYRPLRASQSARLLVAALCATVSLPALSQTTASAPPAREDFDENGVNVATGLFKRKVSYIAIGQGQGSALSYAREEGPIAAGSNLNYALYVGQSKVSAGVGSESYEFTLANNAYSSSDGKGATLQKSGTTYTLTTADGTVVIYNLGGNFTGDGASSRASSVTFASGEKLTLVWKTAGWCSNNLDGCSGGTMVTATHLQSITSSFGYRLHLQYANTSDEPLTASQGNGWKRLVSIKAINLAVDYCDPGANICSTTQAWPSVTIGLSSITDPLGRTTTVSNLTSTYSITDPGRGAPNLVLNLDGARRVTSLTRDGVTWTYAYSVSGNTATLVRTDPNGKTRTYVSDLTIGLPTQVTNELAKTTYYGHDNSGRLTRITSPEGNYTQYSYDGRGNVTETRAVSKTAGTPADIVTLAGYDASCTNTKTCNKPVWTKDALGRQTDYTYDTTHGGVLTVTAPAAPNSVRPQTRYSYTGLQAYYKNGTGSIVASGQTAYRATSVSTCQTLGSCANGADETKTEISYGPQTAGTANNLMPVSVTSKSGDNALAATTSFDYDTVGNQVSVDGPLAGTVDKTITYYDAARQVTGVVGPDPDDGGGLSPRAQRYTYNNDGQVTVSEVGAISSQAAAFSNFYPYQKTTATYDANGRKVKDLVEAGAGASMSAQQIMQYSYDGLGRLDCAALRMDSATWNSQANACLQTSGNSDRISRTSYDAASRVTKVQSGYGTAVQIDEVTKSYTSNGQVATLADAKNNLTTYEYDGFDRLTKTRYPSPTMAGTSSTTDYEQPSYDANSNVTSLRLRDGQSIGFAYDNLSRLVTKDRPGAEPDVSYGYDLLGRMTSASQSGHALSFTYDALGRNLTQSGPLGTVSYQYDLAGRRTRMIWPDGFFTGYNYDNSDALTSIGENSMSALLANFSYDDLARRTGLYRANGAQTYYGYDALSRLTGMKQDPAGTGQDLVIGKVGTEGTPLGYNLASQITQIVRSNDSYAWNGHVNVNRPYTANGLNQYTAAGALNIAYDARGNLTTSGSSTYSYNSENYLTSGPGVTLAYDPLGRLYQTAGSATTRFLYDGQDLIGEYDSAGNRLRRYVHSDSTDEPLIWYEGAGTTDRRMLHADERGSIVAVTNSAGAAITINSYDEYGIPAAGNAGRFQYTGQTWIPELGMYYYKARVYSPTLGRFMQTDPIGYGDGMNMYAYTGNDPVNKTDPSGEQCSITHVPSGFVSDRIVVTAAKVSCQNEPDYHGSGPGNRVTPGDRSAGPDDGPPLGREPINVRR